MKRLPLFFVLLLFFPLLIFSSVNDSWYERGSQSFTIGIGTTIPLTYTDFLTNKTSIGPWVSNYDGTNFSIGGKGSIAYQIFVNSFISLGGEIGYQFNFAKSYDVLTFVPLYFKTTFVLFQKANFEIPLSIGLGGNYISFSGYSKFTFGASLDIGLKYYFMDNWALGISTGIDFVPEFYFSENYNGENKNSIVNSIPIIISITYRA